MRFPGDIFTSEGCVVIVLSAHPHTFVHTFVSVNDKGCGQPLSFESEVWWDSHLCVTVGRSFWLREPRLDKPAEVITYEPLHIDASVFDMYGE